MIPSYRSASGLLVPGGRQLAQATFAHANLITTGHGR
jgi:hypothetical protein